MFLSRADWASSSKTVVRRAVFAAVTASAKNGGDGFIKGVEKFSDGAL
jgi:hypothetical protein